MTGLKREGWGFSFLCCQVPLLFLLQSCRGGADGRFVVFCLSAGTVYGVKPQSVEKFSIANFREFAETAKEKFLFLPNNKDFCKVLDVF